MSSFLYASCSCPSLISNPNLNSDSTPSSYPNRNPCPEFSFQFPALERDYLGLGLGFKEDLSDNKTPASSLLNSPLVNISYADPSPLHDILCGSHLKLAPPTCAADGGGDADADDGDADADDAEPLSANIGWPPISSYRKTTTRALSIKPPCNTESLTPIIVHQHAPLEIAAATTNNNMDKNNDPCTIIMASSPNPRKSLHIKVSMDGTPIMRKLDLESMQGYHHLSMELHKLFKFYKRNLSCEVGAHLCFKDVSGANFILTYKDRDGDWMLVGDTTWETFAQSARRIRIMKKVK